MLEFGMSFIKGMAAPVPSTHDPKKKIKAYEVQGGDVMVWTGATIARFGGAAPNRDDGLYDFDFHEEQHGGFHYSPWFLKSEAKFGHTASLSVWDLTHISNILSAYMKAKGPDDEPMALLKLEKSGPHHVNISLDMMCSDKAGDIAFSLPRRSTAIEPSWLDDNPDLGPFASVQLAYPAKDLLDAISPFTKIKKEALKVLFRYNIDSKGCVDGPVFISVSHLGHRIETGLTFSVEEGSKSVADSSGSEDYGSDSLFVSPDVLKKAGKNGQIINMQVAR